MYPAISAGSESSATTTTSSKLIYLMMSASSAFCACRRFSACPRRPTAGRRARPRRSPHRSARAGSGDDRRRRGQQDELCVDGEAAEVLEPPGALLVLAHARPDVGVEDVGAGRRRARVVRHLDPVERRLVAGRRGGDEAETEQPRSLGQRHADVVAVPDVREPDTLQPAEPFADRHDVGHCLTGMLVVGEPVDDGNGTVPRELVHVRLRERPDHDRVEVAREHDRRVANRLAPAELEVGREVEPRAAELRDADLERHARPR